MTVNRPPLWDEIREQAELFRRRLAEAAQQAGQPPIARPAETCRYLVAIAEGSSKHALEIAAPFLETWIGLPMLVYTPEALKEKFAVAHPFGTENPASLFRHGFFIAVSQSGETTSVLRILEQFKARFHQHFPQQAFPLLTLANRIPSSLSQGFGPTLPIGAGEERSIAATKSMTASLLNILLWGLSVGEQAQRLSPETAEAIRQQLAALPGLMEAVWGQRNPLTAFTRRLTEVNHFILLSKGPLTLILPEAGLKLTETSSNIVYTDNTESFKHGPKVMLAGIAGRHPNAVYVVPNQPAIAEGLFRDIRTHFWRKDPATGEDVLAFEDDRVFFVTFADSPAIPAEIRQGLRVTEDKILTLPTCTPLQSVFLALVAFQLLSCELATLKGESPDNPALNKAVTE